MHNTQGAARPRRMSTDVVQADPAVHCSLQLACGVAALHLTITSDSCTRIREHMQLGAPHAAAAAVWCSQRNVGGGNGSRCVTQARSTGNAYTAVAYSSRPVSRMPKLGKHRAARPIRNKSQMRLVTRQECRSLVPRR